MKKLLDLICEKKVEKVPPIWIMRQAGRYLPEYLEIRKNFEGFLDMCYNPEVASEITLQPIKRFDFDAAIIFSDILVIPDALGVEVKFVKNEGPKLGKIGILDIENVTKHLQPVFENLRITKEKLGKEKTLIGFSGAPFTLACYMVEGGSSKNFDLTKQTAIKNEKYFANLIETLTQAVSIYLIEQIKSGADIVKIFDSWAGILPQDQFQKWVIEPTKKIIANVKKVYPNTPIIAFPKGSGVFYEQYAKDVSCDVLAIDQNLSSEFVVDVLQNQENKIIQGNLDNFLLCYGSKDEIKRKTMEILEDFGQKPFIFNLGHGIIKDTPIENVEFLLKTIRG